MSHDEFPSPEPRTEIPSLPETPFVTPAFQATPEPPETRLLKSMLFGPNGVRVGWSAALFIALTAIILVILGTATSAFVHKVLHAKTEQFSPLSAIIGELISTLGILGAAWICARVERRRILDYNLSGAKRLRYFLIGIVAGFAALSALVGALYEGHWLRFGTISLSGASILEFGAMWGIAFLLTGFFEEGSFRCYLQYTLTRGINFWWAFGILAVICASGLIFQKGEGIWGIYIIAALGLVPCLLLHLSKSPSSGFWQAAWVTSTLFGFIHTGNNGENWIGIFAAAAIGFVFCVSIRLTGSAWWAIGFHAAWDWAETFFYGTADSGFQPKGHYLTSNPAGAVLWSGGTDGPEGSLLVIPIILLTLIALIAVYGRRRAIQDQHPLESPSGAAHPQLS